MTFAQLLTLFAVICLGSAALLARNHLRRNRGLRRGFAGLFVSGWAGIALTFSTSPAFVLLFALMMLAGIGFLVLNLNLDGQP